MEEQRTEAEAVAKIVEQHLKPEILELPPAADRGDEDVRVIAKPRGVELVSIKPFLDEYLEAPRRRKGTAQLADLDSFIAHANRFKHRDSILFADPDPDHPALVAVLDYHSASKTAFGEHRARYAFPLSDEWKAWSECNGKAMTQETFAHLIEDRIADVAEPDNALPTVRQFAGQLHLELASPARLMELSRGLSVVVNARVASHQNLSTGEAQLQYVEQHQHAETQPGKTLKVPGAFLVAIPVFRGGARYQLPVRLRYRVHREEGSIRWIYSLYRTDLVFTHAFNEACEAAHKATELPLLKGHPENG